MLDEIFYCLYKVIRVINYHFIPLFLQREWPCFLEKPIECYLVKKVKLLFFHLYYLCCLFLFLQWITDGHKNHLSELQGGVFNIRRSINNKKCFSNLGHFQKVSTRKGSRIKKKSLEERHSSSAVAATETVTLDNNNGSLTTTKNNRKDKKSIGLMKSFRNMSKHSTWPKVIPWYVVIPWCNHPDNW